MGFLRNSYTGRTARSRAQSLSGNPDVTLNVESEHASPLPVAARPLACLPTVPALAEPEKLSAAPEWAWFGMDTRANGALCARKLVRKWASSVSSGQGTFPDKYPSTGN